MNRTRRSRNDRRTLKSKRGASPLSKDMTRGGFLKMAGAALGAAALGLSGTSWAPTGVEYPIVIAKPAPFNDPNKPFTDFNTIQNIISQHAGTEGVVIQLAPSPSYPSPGAPVPFIFPQAATLQGNNGLALTAVPGARVGGGSLTFGGFSILYFVGVSSTNTTFNIPACQGEVVVEGCNFINGNNGPSFRMSGSQFHGNTHITNSNFVSSNGLGGIELSGWDSNTAKVFISGVNVTVNNGGSGIKLANMNVADVYLGRDENNTVDQLVMHVGAHSTGIEVTGMQLSSATIQHPDNNNVSMIPVDTTITISGTNSSGVDVHDNLPTSTGRVLALVVNATVADIVDISANEVDSYSAVESTNSDWHQIYMELNQTLLADPTASSSTAGIKLTGSDNVEILGMVINAFNKGSAIKLSDCDNVLVSNVSFGTQTKTDYVLATYLINNSSNISLSGCNSPTYMLSTNVAIVDSSLVSVGEPENKFVLGTVPQEGITLTDNSGGSTLYPVNTFLSDKVGVFIDPSTQCEVYLSCDDSYRLTNTKVLFADADVTGCIFDLSDCAEGTEYQVENPDNQVSPPPTSGWVNPAGKTVYAPGMIVCKNKNSACENSQLLR